MEQQPVVAFRVRLAMRLGSTHLRLRLIRVSNVLYSQKIDRAGYQRPVEDEDGAMY